MHIHILGICGTFMGSLAILAKQKGFRVTGSDANVYPPMSTQLMAQGIELISGWDVAQLNPRPDVVIIGNAMSRGNPVVEAVLDLGIPYTSGPAWLKEHILQGRWVMAVAGTHGKTTTSSMLLWILQHANMAPGYLIGGIPQNSQVSASLGESDFFVVEADEYDSAFFDKRSKFVHYLPRTLVINNLEFDHADIFDSIEDIERQVHHCVRTVPSQGLIIYPEGSKHIESALDKGCWTPLQTTSIVGMPLVKNAPEGTWQAKLINTDGSAFELLFDQQKVGEVHWDLTGMHNVYNGLSALSAARHVGILPAQACAALGEFAGVKRRMELIGDIGGVKVFDDFAHHPTAIETTLQGLRENLKDQVNCRIIAVIEPRSNTMKLGSHQAKLAPSTALADKVCWYQPANLGWGLEQVADDSSVPAQVYDDLSMLLDDLVEDAQTGDHIVIMSNGSFGGLHQQLVEQLKVRNNA
jgi:UDP-N-acetylmuramate: L-alanyl-gamma-D-glutamyl-meso-diaminopimelate ligase